MGRLNDQQRFIALAFVAEDRARHAAAEGMQYLSISLGADVVRLREIVFWIRKRNRLNIKGEDTAEADRKIVLAQSNLNHNHALPEEEEHTAFCRAMDKAACRRYSRLPERS